MSVTGLLIVVDAEETVTPVLEHNKGMERMNIAPLEGHHSVYQGKHYRV